MSKGPKTASKTTSSNRFLAFLMVMPFVVYVISFLPPHLRPKQGFYMGLFFDKIGFLFNENPVLGVFLIVLTVIVIDSIAKAMGGGLKLGDTTELSDYEGK